MSEGTLSFSTNVLMSPGLIVPFICVTNGNNSLKIYPDSVFSGTGPIGATGSTG